MSDNHPIGLMVFGGASLQGIPWEVIVKEFRKSLGRTSFPQLSGYADGFFNFIEGHIKLFPESYRDRITIDEARSVVETSSVSTPVN